ncbi:uncharacterized protein BCR38DRAFT_122546 [Pseudomassariella vexata]|uniref:alpha-galactosidase n=1 Tax=Pseudomassariella vexata TaxID=1141098 RepID=A0A1Y2DAC4_9PEZI|nr:uncharacterized protein BCR38DRAFT_122546 [Pseudomassariella vexata]ORY55615.1 hypothetical protein BCR38DRAFT_122546 [Pseudomassariella vexata]
MADLGLKDLGYEYANIGDRWSDKELWRDSETNKIIVDTEKYPDGLKPIVD